MTRLLADLRPAPRPRRGMHGHEQIIAARRAGQRPAFVMLVDYPLARSEWELAHDTIPCVSVHGEDPAFADLRFLAGCTVALSCERSFDWLDTVLRAGAKHVVEYHPPTGELREWHQ